MEYLDYQFYRDTYKGSVTEDDFTRLEAQARALINYYTFNRITTVDDNIRYAMSELIEIIDKEAQGIVTSETVGSHSITYAKNEAVTGYRQSAKAVIFKWLQPALYYRGL